MLKIKRKKKNHSLEKLLRKSKVIMRHMSAKSSHYDKEAEKYDEFNEVNSQIINGTIEKILKHFNASSVVDFSCGTGSQVFYLSKRGYDVIGLDINARMLAIAQVKAKSENLPLRFIKGDMRVSKIGNFDAAITIFNAIGHLTTPDFEKTLQNIHQNLKKEGLYIFDIFNAAYLLDGDNITKLTIDWQTAQEEVISRIIQYSTINVDGVLVSYTTFFSGSKNQKPKITKERQTLQTYSAEKLETILNRNGFAMLAKSAIDGTPFDPAKTDRMLIVAQRR
jgi:ubiquinone/menaquinone biosynthesis C-methylase UbiE